MFSMDIKDEGSGQKTCTQCEAGGLELSQQVPAAPQLGRWVGKWGWGGRA